MKIQFHISEGRNKQIPIRGLKALQAAQRGKEPSIEGLCNVLATFMCDDEQVYFERAQAEELLDDLTEEQLTEVIAQFVKAWQEFNLPKAKGSRSMKPSNSADAAPGG